MIEKWCYFFKYASSTSEEDVRKIIDSDLVIQRAYEVLNRFNWSEIELLTYEKEIKQIMDNQAVEAYMKEQARQEGDKKGRQEGRQEGIRIGQEKGKLEIAKSMREKGYPIEDIRLLTSLSRSQIQDLVISLIRGILRCVIRRGCYIVGWFLQTFFSYFSFLFFPLF